MKAHAQMLLVLFAAVVCFVLGCSRAPRVSHLSVSPDGKYLAEVVEIRVPEWDRRFEARITGRGTNAAQVETIYRSPDEGHAAERFLWSKDSRYLLLVGKTLGVGPECMTDRGEAIYLLYDVEKRETRCNSGQLSVSMNGFGFEDLAGIDFGEKLRPATVGSVVP